MVKRKKNLGMLMGNVDQGDSEVVEKSVGSNTKKQKMEQETKNISKKKRKKDFDMLVDNVEQESDDSDSELVEESVGSNTKKQKMEQETKKISKKKRKKDLDMLIDNVEQESDNSDSELVEKSVGSSTKKQKLKQETKKISKQKRKKKKKKPKVIKEEKNVNRKKESCIEYLKKWQEDRSNWKFEKLKQIWLCKNMFDAEQVSQSMFPILVDYLSFSMGHARETTVTKAMEVIKNMEKWSELSSKGLSEEEITTELSDKVTEGTYKRAKLLLQSIDI